MEKVIDALDAGDPSRASRALQDGDPVDAFDLFPLLFSYTEALHPRDAADMQQVMIDVANTCSAKERLILVLESVDRVRSASAVVAVARILALTIPDLPCRCRESVDELFSHLIAYVERHPEMPEDASVACVHALTEAISVLAPPIDSLLIRLLDIPASCWSPGALPQASDLLRLVATTSSTRAPFTWPCYLIPELWIDHGIAPSPCVYSPEFRLEICLPSWLQFITSSSHSSRKIANAITLLRSWLHSIPRFSMSRSRIAAMMPIFSAIISFVQRFDLGPARSECVQCFSLLLDVLDEIGQMLVLRRLFDLNKSTIPEREKSSALLAWLVDLYRHRVRLAAFADELDWFWAQLLSVQCEEQTGYASDFILAALNLLRFQTLAGIRLDLLGVVREEFLQPLREQFRDLDPLLSDSPNSQISMQMIRSVFVRTAQVVDETLNKSIQS